MVLMLKFPDTGRWTKSGQRDHAERLKSKQKALKSCGSSNSTNTSNSVFLPIAILVMIMAIMMAIACCSPGMPEQTILGLKGPEKVPCL